MKYHLQSIKRAVVAKNKKKSKLAHAQRKINQKVAKSNRRKSVPVKVTSPIIKKMRKLLNEVGRINKLIA